MVRRGARGPDRQRRDRDHCRISEPQVDGDDPTAHTDGPKGNDRPEGEGETDRLQRLAEFREQTRGQRMAIASAAQVRWRRTVSWGARCGDTDAIFTHVAAPVMTRLTFSERQVLDTLVDAGVAGSRSEASPGASDRCRITRPNGSAAYARR
jgi:hypothetical protein